MHYSLITHKVLAWSLLSTLLLPGIALAEETPAPAPDPTPVEAASDPAMGSTMDASRTGIFGLDIGSEAPDFTVRTFDGREVTLRRDLINQRDWTVLMTYRGDWARESEAQLEYFMRTNALIQDRNARVIAITTDSPERIAAISRRGTLPYEVLSDPQATMARNYNLLKPVTEAEYRQYVMDHTYTADGQTLSEAFDFRANTPELGNNILQPAVMILDPQGIVRYVEELPEVPLTEDDQTIIEELARLQAPELQSSATE